MASDNDTMTRCLLALANRKGGADAARAARAIKKLGGAGSVQNARDVLESLGAIETVTVFGPAKELGT